MLTTTHTKPYISSLFLCSTPLPLMFTCYLSIFYLCSLFAFLLAYCTYFHPSYPHVALLRPLIIRVSLYTRLKEHHHRHHHCRHVHCPLCRTNCPHHHHPNSHHHPALSCPLHPPPLQIAPPPSPSPSRCPRQTRLPSPHPQ